MDGFGIDTDLMDDTRNLYGIVYDDGIRRNITKRLTLGFQTSYFYN